MATLTPMSQKELSRYEVIRLLLDGKIRRKEASARLDLSTKQIGRLAVKVAAEGVKGLAHKLRGRKSNRGIKEEEILKAAGLLHAQYSDFGPTFAAEKLAKRDGIRMSRERVRKLLIAEGLWRARPRRENGTYHAWRERRGMYGELEQFDGSYHLWFEDRAVECCLLASIDDATGTITKAGFGEGGEGIRPVFGFWNGYMQDLGKPSAIYLDRGSTYKVNAKALVDDPLALTQFERAMRDLAVEVIHAHSPQAKGRIERLFGTLQDRLVKELRLAGISTIPEANIFLRDTFIPDFNSRFGVRARSEGDAHRALLDAEKASLPSILSFRETRTVASDFTLLHRGVYLQLAKDQLTLVCRGDKVMVETRLDGAMHILLRGKELKFEALPERPRRASAAPVTALAPGIPRKPAPDHPWRRQFTIPFKVDI